MVNVWLPYIASLLIVICALILWRTRRQPGPLLSGVLPDLPEPGRPGLCRVYFTAPAGQSLNALTRDSLRGRLLWANPQDSGDGRVASALVSFERMVDRGDMTIRLGGRYTHRAYFGPFLVDRGTDNPELRDHDQNNLRTGNAVIEVSLREDLLDDAHAVFIFEHIVFALADLLSGSIHETGRDVVRTSRMFGAAIRPLPFDA